jgi:hypothetical protein
VDLTTANDYRKRDVGAVKPVTVDANQDGLCFFGTIQGAKEGSNKVYTVKLFNKDQIVKANQILIGTDSPPIPKDTPVLMLKSGGQYYFQAPVWLKPNTGT